jgi:hypothetical protein
MGSLGNVLEPDPAHAGKPRGIDLHVEIEVPPSALGDPDGYAAKLSLRVPHAGERTQRFALPGEEEFLRLHLPESLPEGAVLRLRRQGGVCEGGVPGDLFAKIKVSETAPAPFDGAALAPRTISNVWVGTIIAVLLAAAAALLLL